jgi:hypothetical protein
MYSDFEMTTQFPVKELNQYFKTELSNLAKSLGLDTYGTKAQLCARILGLSASTSSPQIESNNSEEIYIAVNCDDLDQSPVLGLYSTRDVAITQSYNYLKDKHRQNKKLAHMFDPQKSTLEDKENVIEQMGIHISVQKLNEPVTPLQCGKFNVIKTQD